MPVYMVIHDYFHRGSGCRRIDLVRYVTLSRKPPNNTFNFDNCWYYINANKTDNSEVKKWLARLTHNIPKKELQRRQTEKASGDTERLLLSLTPVWVVEQLSFL